jgi:hypothetical protein
MGDLTRSIVNRAHCPVLVARPGTGIADGGFWSSLRRIFASGTPPDEKRTKS